MHDQSLVVDVSDSLLAAVLSTGLRLGAVGERSDVVRWADRELERREHVPMWLIDLSMSHDRHILDVISILRAAAGDVDRLAICRGLYSLVPPLPQSYAYDQYATLAKHLYRQTYDVLEGDWNTPLLADADIVADNFGWIRDGHPGRVGDSMVPMTRDEVVRGFLDFLNAQRDDRIRLRLIPVHYLLPACIEDY